MKTAGRILFTLFAVMFSWTAACWFSEPFDRPFLGVSVFRVDAAVPFLLSIIALAGALLFWLISSGRTAVARLREWLAGNRLFAVGIVALLILHVLLQIPSIVMYQGANNGDSGQYGISSYHIAAGEIRPMYMLGKRHIGSLPHHLTAVLHIVFGKNPAHLRIVTSLFYFGFIVLFASLMKKLSDSRTALYAAALAAIPPYQVYFSTCYTEFPEILFWGAAALLICAHMIRGERPSAWQYFLLGLISGLGLWAHPQFLSFLLAAMLMLFIRDKLFFIRPRVLTLIPGFLIGGIVILVSSYFYRPQYIEVFSNISMDAGQIVSRVTEAAAKFVLYIPTYLGLQTRETAAWLFHPAIATAVLLLFVVCLAVYIFIVRDELKRVSLFRNFSVGKLTAALVFLSVFLIFSGTGPVRDIDSTRYIFPVWPAIVAILAISLAAISRKRRVAGYSMLALFLAIFFISTFHCLTQTADREGYHREWVEFCRENGISRFYGPWIRTYWTNYVTGEEIVGANFPFRWEPYIEYQRIVDRSKGPLAYMFAPSDTYQIKIFEADLAALGVAYQKKTLAVGEVAYALSERVAFKQLTGLKTGKYSAEILRRECSAITGLGGENALVLIAVQVRNSGNVTWLPTADNGHIELVAIDEQRQILRRGILAKPVEPGGELSWRFIIERGDLVDGIGVDVRVNDVPILQPDGPLKIDLNTDPSGKQISVRELNPVRLRDERHNLLAEDFIFLDGWGERTAKGIWSGGERSVIGFVLRKPRDLDLVMRIEPFEFKSVSRGVEQVSLRLNGISLGKPFILEQARSIQIPLSASAQRSGLNVLSLSYSIVEPEMRIVKHQPRFRLRPRAVGIHFLRLKNVRDDEGS